MSNRVIKDSITTSPTLAKLKFVSELHWPRWLLMADDWGCFNANSLVIRGFLFPLRSAEMTLKKIDELKLEYNQKGLLFLWNIGGREWGFFPSWDNHHSYCNKTNADNDGKQQKHRRKTPIPPQKELNEYLQKFGVGLVQVSTPSDIFPKNLNPIPIPTPNPKPKESKRAREEFVFLSDIEFEKLITRLGDKKTQSMISEVNNHLGKIGEKAAKKYVSHYHTILSWVNKNEKENPSLAKRKPIAKEPPPKPHTEADIKAGKEALEKFRKGGIKSFKDPCENKGGQRTKFVKEANSFKWKKEN